LFAFKDNLVILTKKFNVFMEASKAAAAIFMATAVGVCVTIFVRTKTGRLDDQKSSGEVVRIPENQRQSKAIQPSNPTRDELLVDLDASIPSSARAEYLREHFKNLTSTDPEKWIALIYSYCEGLERKIALIYLITHLQKTNQNFDHMHVLSLVNQGEDRKAVFDILCENANQTQVGKLAEWLKSNALPEESYSLISSLLEGGVSQSLALDMLSRVSDSDRLVLLGGLGRNTARRGRDLGWIVELSRGLKGVEAARVSVGFLESAIKETGLSVLNSAAFRSFSPEVSELVLRSVGREQGAEKIGSEAYGWAQKNYSSQLRPFIDGLIHGWMSRDLHEVTGFLRNQPSSNVKNDAVMTLVARLSKMGLAEEAKAWSQTLSDVQQN
jgi:hypothetical protein